MVTVWGQQLHPKAGGLRAVSGDGQDCGPVLAGNQSASRGRWIATPGGAGIRRPLNGGPFLGNATGMVNPCVDRLVQGRISICRLTSIDVSANIEILRVHQQKGAPSKSP